MTSVALSDEQRLLVTVTERLVTDHPTLVDPGPERALVEGALWDSVVDCGLVGLAVPARSAAEDEPTLNAALVLEQLARGVSSAPYLGTVLALSLLEAAAPGGVEVTELLAGRRGCVVLTPTLHAAAPRGVAVDVGPGVLTIGLDGDAVCTSELGAPCDGLDLSRALVNAPRSGLTLGIAAPEAIVRWRALALALVCADIVGTCSGALEAAVEHARVRHQFGRPVGSFQAVQQLCADQLVSVEGCRSITWQAAWAADALDPAEALALARIAKAYCSEVARTVCEAAIQVWGGLGMTWECPAHRYLRRALLDRHLFGDERVHLAAIAEARLGSPPGPVA